MVSLDGMGTHHILARQSHESQNRYSVLETLTLRYKSHTAWPARVQIEQVRDSKTQLAIKCDCRTSRIQISKSLRSHQNNQTRCHDTLKHLRSHRHRDVRNQWLESQAMPSHYLDRSETLESKFNS